MLTPFGRSRALSFCGSDTVGNLKLEDIELEAFLGYLDPIVLRPTSALDEGTWPLLGLGLRLPVDEEADSLRKGDGNVIVPPLTGAGSESLEYQH